MPQTPEGAMKANAKRLGMTLDEYKSLIDSGMKRCTACKTWHPRSNYNVDRSRGDGLCSKCHDCTRVKVRKTTKGRPSNFKGKTHTPEAIALMSASKKGKQFRLGIKHTDETKAKISRMARERTPRGENHYAFSHGRSQRSESDRRTVEYQDWRTAVFSRDCYRCQMCGDDRGGNLHAHHVKSFADHPELRFSVDNGITVCQDCHEKIHLKPIPTRTDLRRRRKHGS